MGDLTSINISDGFQHVHTFTHHVHSLRHCGLMDAVEERYAGSGTKSTKRLYISADSKHIVLWDFNGIHNQLRFPKIQPDFISAIVYISPLRIFFAAALDMCFKIYDKQLRLVESIRHSERSILAIEYVDSKGLLLISGATGVSCWRVFKQSYLKSDKMDFVVEKLFVFPSPYDAHDSWVSVMIIDELNGKHCISAPCTVYSKRFILRMHLYVEI